MLLAGARDDRAIGGDSGAAALVDRMRRAPRPRVAAVVEAGR